eukprot:864302-Prymnesium_polylepis.1
MPWLLPPSNYAYPTDKKTGHFSPPVSTQCARKKVSSKSYSKSRIWQISKLPRWRHLRGMEAQSLHTHGERLGEFLRSRRPGRAPGTRILSRQGLVDPLPRCGVRPTPFCADAGQPEPTNLEACTASSTLTVEVDDRRLWLPVRQPCHAMAQRPHDTTMLATLNRLCRSAGVPRCRPAGASLAARACRRRD